MRITKSANAPEGVTTADIVQRLEEEIALGVLRPRERLVEDDLLARFRTKRHVVRQALLDLETMGIVSRPPNRGAIVRDLGREELEQIYFVRELLERAAMEVMPLPADPQVLRNLTDLHERHTKASKEGRLRDVFRLNLDFHKALFDACGNVPLSEAILQFAFKAHAIRSYTIGDAKLLARVCEEHGRIIKLMRGGEANRAALIKVISEHKRPAKQAYEQALQRIEQSSESPPPPR
ncbi:GntR family transcriptional regulator [Verminephrobacter eiseniae]|uniref:GntR family transcriptional regulator n=1 Tax=Verminephrobacter eiseniae TaxID=364317 RepID=UPI002237D49B|nr:GntR family transcriptional regulator [Verminephrobacter eiseniae]MCW5232265.1 GntR family transcriptional regulator [Verminephrobacter eiseniae]MCW5296172.1 GntR family transcriptional regulator [Verminephrobacter eiseniae]MCW8185429.1 GntR family transcriptional regulator [Verminephrobacter eiseniae]MCW8224096.1 GntR family transcriptional regulator [Verminephrobacter eiseniae]MCW8235226.1 GntR family transcriptional regulator [Verminephrobacter eiseniae]